MKFYQDITLLPDSEIGIGFLWQKVFTQVHLSLVEAAKRNAKHGVAFPGYGEKLFPLGNKVRVFSETERQLEAIELSRWLNRLADYCHISSFKLVPEECGYACYRRKQFKSNPERLARRRAKRKGESYEQALAHYSDFKGQDTKLPFIRLKSLSGGGKDDFSLYIAKESMPSAVGGGFNCYGLSDGATVPDF